MRLSRRLTYTCRHDLPLVIGGLPLVIIYVAERLAGVDPDHSVTIALIALAVLLGGYG